MAGSHEAFGDFELREAPQISREVKRNISHDIDDGATLPELKEIYGDETVEAALTNNINDIEKIDPGDHGVSDAT